MADLNGYTALYESRSGNTQTYGVGGALSCNLDVAGLTAAACDVNIDTSMSGAAINTAVNGAGTVFCIAKGDYSTKGTITITASGTSGTRKIMRYYDAADDGLDPWNQSAANQATFKRLLLNGDYWIVHRLQIERGDSAGRTEVNGLHNIISHCVVENSTVRLLRINNQDNCVQNSVVRKAGDDFVAGSDEHGIDYGGGNVTNCRIVNCEIYDCQGDCIQNNASTDCSGLIVENNDIYVTSAYQTLADTGRSCSEGGLDLKHPLATSGNPARILHNRIWGFKDTDTSCGGTGGNGEGILLNGGLPGDPADYCLIHNNILMDLPGAIGINADEGGFNSVIGNLIYDVYDSSGLVTPQAFKLQDAYNTEVYLNTVISSLVNWARLDDNGTCDYRGNVFIDCGAHSGSLGASSQADNNTYYGVSGTKLDTTYTNKTLTTLAGSFCTNRGCTSTANTSTLSVGDIVRTSDNPKETCTGVSDTDCYLYKVLTVGTSGTIQAVRGPYAFYRKLQTNPELVVIPYAVPHSSAPEYNSAPEQGESNAIGSRTSIGVDNTQLGSGGFMDTGIKGPRTN